ncbi:WXG100 family type VII secretion target [Streptomyces sp. RKAG337]|uniref:WXG100 family type VII secretion target n=1 Tax=Streptomyces sp. RKAG337 TaxID=2893404 RepID=UPI0020338915|nr:WXG100 family type VII secretion target [Streptomyces sp. RKAG337]MCM2426996.1 WXG100 family type VII secretion target [Streptomyces sp. RKAG337]
MVDLNPLHHSLNPLHYLHKLNEAIGHSTADVLEFIGVTDPAVDPDGIRETAKHWKDLAKDLSDASWHTMNALDGVQWEGKAAEAFAARAHEVRGHADKVCGILDKGEEALQHFADEAHELISEIGVIAAEIIEFEAAALALTLITGPIAEAAAAIASGERAMKIMALIARIEEAGRRMARILEALIESVGGLARALKALESIAKMALSGAGTALAWDALFDTERLKDPGTIKDDVEAGAMLGVLFGSAGKGISKLVGSLRPLGLDLAHIGTDLGTADGGAGGPAGLLDRLLMAMPDWLRERFESGNKFNTDNHSRFPYNEVAVEPINEGDVGRPRLDSYKHGLEIVSRKESQLADVTPATAKGYLDELVKKYSPGTEIRARKYPALYGQKLKGQMILEVPAQNGVVPAEVLEYARTLKIVVRDVTGRTYT